jgi:hypothetical protein
VKPSSRVEKPEAAPEMPVTTQHLTIAPGLGVTAWIENDCLQLCQGTDVVALSQTEAKVLFAQFQDWAA